MILYFFLPETVADASNDENKSPKKNETEDETAVGWGELLEDKRWWGLSIFQLGANFGLAAKIASVPIIASSVLPGGAVGAGALLSAAGLSGLIGGPVGGLLTDRFGAKTTVLCSGLLSSVALVSVPFALDIPSPEGLPSGAAFAASILLWSTSVAAQGPASTALAQELAPDGAEATAMALPRASGDASYLVAPFLLGLVADLNGIAMGSDVAMAGLIGLIGVAALSIL
jgi:MFS family permease